MDSYEKVVQLKDCIQENILVKEPMCRHTTFQIGGPADVYITVESEQSLHFLLKQLHENHYPYHVIGKGSNLLVSDSGIRGAVIALGSAFEFVRLADEFTIECGAAASLAQVCAFAREHSLTGLEFAWGIPGSAGGAAFMNAGAYGGEMKDVLLSCSHVCPDGKCGTLSGDALNLSYRHSAYTDNGCVITSMKIRLQPGDKQAINDRMDELMDKRRSKQPLEYPSAGSVFKRPEGFYAGTLIEQCGLKGSRVGGAMVSEKHAGFIINAGNATCSDVMSLIRFIQETVYHKTGVQLECEIRTVD